MFTKSYSELVEYLGRVVPIYSYVMHLGVLHIDDNATIVITDQGYVLDYGDHTGTYTDLDHLASGILLTLR